jgi:NADP-dependent 3-hydroxy acid dehydrogenase YdfG
VRADAAERIGKGNSAKVDTFPVDVARADDVRAAARAIPEKHGQIDPLVNNAGLNVLKRFRERYLFGSREYRHWSKMLQPDDVGKTIAFVESMMSVDASSGGQNARWSTTGSRCTEWGT